MRIVIASLVLASAAFAQQRIATEFTGPWTIGWLAENAPEVPVDFAPVPDAVEVTADPLTGEQFAEQVDLMPTLLGLMKLPIPATVQGRDASAAVLQGRDDGVEALPLFFLPLNWRGVFLFLHWILMMSIGCRNGKKGTLARLWRL